MDENLESTWIYSLQDEDLISYCNEFELDLPGSYRECCDSFERFLNAEHKPLRMLRLLELQRKHSKDVSNVSSPTKQLKEKINRRYQRFGESFEHFACELQKLMQELNYSESQQFIIILRNSQPVYQHFLKRKHCSKLHELMTLSEELEEIRDCMLEETRTSQIYKQLRYDASHIYATIYVCEIRAIATIDTGASRSFLSEDYVAKLGKRCRYVPVNADVTLADGSVRVLKFAVEGQVRMGNICSQFQFIIMPDASEDIILGLDFCMHVGATFSCGGETIQLENCAKAPIVPEIEVNAMKTSLERRETNPSSEVQSSTCSAERRICIEESATKPSCFPNRRREGYQSQTHTNNSIPTPYSTRQQVHPMPLFSDPYTGISFSSNHNQNVENSIEKQFSFNPMINFPAAQWSQCSNISKEGYFSEQQSSSISTQNGPDNYSKNYFISKQGPNGIAWNETNAFSESNFAKNQNENRPGWNGNESLYGINLTNNQPLNSLAWNNPTTFPENNLLNNQGPNLAAAQSTHRGASIAVPTAVQPLLKTTKPAQENPPPNDFSKYDAETTAKLNKILMQASKGDNLLHELSTLQIIHGQLFKILVDPNRNVYIMDVPDAGANKNPKLAKNANSTLSGTEKCASTSATSWLTSQIKKPALGNPQQAAKIKEVVVPLKNYTQQKASVINHEQYKSQTQVPQTASHETSGTDEANIQEAREMDHFPSAAKRQKTDKNQANAQFEPVSSKALTEPLPADQKTASNPKILVNSDVNLKISRKRQLTLKPKTGIPTKTSLLKTRSSADNQQHQPSLCSSSDTVKNKQAPLERATPSALSKINALLKIEATAEPADSTASSESYVTTDVPINLEEKDALSCVLKSEMPDETESQDFAELGVAPPNPKPTASESTNLNPIASTTETSNNTALTNLTILENPDKPNDFRMYDAETTSELRQLVKDSFENSIFGRRKHFLHKIRDQLFSVSVSRKKVVTIVPKTCVPAPKDTSKDELQNKLSSQANKEKRTSTHATPQATEIVKAHAGIAKDEHKEPQLNLLTDPQCSLVTTTHSSSNNNQMPTTSQKVPHEIQSAVPTVDLDLSMYDEESAAELLELALSGASGEPLKRRSYSCLREIRGRTFKMIIARNRKIKLRPLEPKVGDIET